MINKRQIELLGLLLLNDTPITGNLLGKHLGVSGRTIRTDVSIINKDRSLKGVLIQAVNPQGYFVSVEDRLRLKFILDEFRQNLSESILPQTPSERLTYFALILLLNETKLTMQELSEYLFVSKATINSDIHRMMEYLEESHSKVSIMISAHGMSLEGTEIDKRKFVVNWISYQPNGMMHLYQSMNLIIPDNILSNDSIELYQRIVNLLEIHQIYLPDQEVQSFIIYLIIAVNRISKDHKVYTSSHKQQNDLIHDIIQSVQEVFQISIDSNEAIFIQKIFDAKSLIHTDAVNADNEVLTTIIDTFLVKANEKYSIDFTSNHNLKQFLYVHIRSMINRLKLNQYENNPLKEDIKKKFPLATEISFLLYNILKNEMDLLMNDSEISYIALHIASALEILITPTKVILVSDLGQSTTRLLATKLMHFFTNKINLVNQITVYQYNSMSLRQPIDVDLIITTSAINAFSKAPIIKVNPLLFRDDIANIKHYVHYYSSEIKDKNRFGELFDERLFYRLPSSTYNYPQVIQYLVTKLKSFDYIEDESEYYSLVMEREQTYSTIMTNAIAIPHAAENRARKTVIAVAILDKPIVYEDKIVSVVLLNAINEKENLQNLYMSIEVILEIEDITLLVNSNSLKSFISILTNMKEEVK